jgi:ferredoxin
MKIELRYFTGTGNSWKVLDTCREVFGEAGHQVHISKLDPMEKKIEGVDLIGFAFPVYAFGMPRIVLKYLRSLKSFNNKQNIFFIFTAGDANGAGLGTLRCARILKRKNCDLIYSDVIKMPNNWIPFSTILTMDENTTIIEAGVERSKQIATNILNNKTELFDYKKQPWFFKSPSNIINIMFRNFGLYGLKSMFKLYPSCNGCGICAKACPTHTIIMVNGKPKWSGTTCEQCMRCIHICPQESIYQFPASTKGKNRYMEPDFKPLED